MAHGLSARLIINCLFTGMVRWFFKVHIRWALSQRRGYWDTALCVDSLLVVLLRPMTKTCPTLGGDSATEAQFPKLIDPSPTLLSLVLGSAISNSDRWTAL